jgi:mitogen-activated protein kinase kinase
MSSPSPVPLLRPPVPGQRSQSGSRTPRLTLGIPPSPSVKPVGGDGHPPVPDLPSLRPATRPTAPKLSLATPMGSHSSINESGTNLRPQALALNMSAVNGSSDAGNRLRSESLTMLDGRASGPESASSSQYSALSSFMGTRQGQIGTPDNPSSAISSVYSDTGGVPMEREGSMGGLLPDLEQLSLEKGRPLDVEDLDDEGWRAASEQKKILELGSLGEGAGGAVTRCILQGGKIVFALKVRSTFTTYWDKEF